MMPTARVDLFSSRIKREMHKFASDRHSAWCSQGNKVNLLSSVMSESKSRSPSEVAGSRHSDNALRKPTLLLCTPCPRPAQFLFCIDLSPQRGKDGLWWSRPTTVLATDSPRGRETLFLMAPTQVPGKTPIGSADTCPSVNPPLSQGMVVSDWPGLGDLPILGAWGQSRAFWTRGTENKWGVFPHGTLWSRFQIKRHRCDQEQWQETARGNWLQWGPRLLLTSRSQNAVLPDPCGEWGLLCVTGAGGGVLPNQ